MKNGKLLLTILLFSFLNNLSAQNPFLTHLYSADPSARVFGDRIYVYPSHDILATEGKGRVGWFCMEDYHVFSSANMTDWTDHGMIVSQTTVPWANPTSYSMWAPDCISRNGKYYFYFPTNVKDTSFGRGFGIGVAVADKPTGPFTPMATPIKDVHGIDPCVFIDKDGQAYLYWAQGRLFVAKLKENMLELDGPVKEIENMPSVGLKEGPYLFERNGIYYFTYPHVQNKTERLEYAMGSSPMGPFKVAGVIMDESASGCWTNHQSMAQFKNQWYLFYHDKDLSPRFDKARSIRVDSMFFNEDGTIKKVIPTLRGVGLTSASRNIQVDRFSSKSDQGTSIDFIDTLNRFGGWKTMFDANNAWIQYNSVDFGKTKFSTVNVRALSATGGTLQIRLNNPDGPVIAEVKVPKTNDWKTVSASVKGIKPGVQNLVVQLKGDANVAADWVSFK